MTKVESVTMSKAKGLSHEVLFVLGAVHIEVEHIGVKYPCRHRTRKPPRNVYKQALTHFTMASWMQRQKPFRMPKYASGYSVILSDLETAALCLPMYNVSRINLSERLTVIRKPC